VEEHNVDIFSFNDDTYIVQYAESFSDDYTIQRAKERLHPAAQRRYNRFNIFTNNCEGFARWAKTGRNESDQIEDCFEVCCVSLSGLAFRVLTVAILLLINGIVPVDDTHDWEIWQQREAWVSLAFASFWMIIIAVFVIRGRCRERVGALLEFNDSRTICRRCWRPDCCAVNCGFTASIIAELFFAWFAPMILVAVVQFLSPTHRYIAIILAAVLFAGFAVGYLIGIIVGRCLEQTFNCMCRRCYNACEKKNSCEHRFPHSARHVSEAGVYCAQHEGVVQSMHRDSYHSRVWLGQP